jgi:8-oxo-dGTP pyrophosphatase MutT (NUDIX family)
MAQDWSVPDDRPIERRAEIKAYENKFAVVYDDEVTFAPVGFPGRYLRIVEANGAPGAVALPTCGDLVGLVLVYRYPLGEWEWGLPRGFAHSGDAEVTIRAELEEELGAAPASLRPLGRVRPNSGLLAGTVAMFHAVYPEPVNDPQDREVREVRWVPLPDLVRAVADGHVEDGFTLAALAAATVRGLVTLPSVTT